MKALSKVLNSPWRYVEWAIVSIAIFLLFVFIPVWTTPGNDFFFQLMLIDPFVLVLMATLSIANGLLILMQFHIRQQVREKKRIHEKAVEGATAFGIVASALAATVACAACYSSILAFIGLGAAAVLVEYRIWIALFALGLTAFALFYSARRINNNCEVCSIALGK